VIRSVILILLVLFSRVGRSDSLEIMGGSLTDHYQSNPAYVGKIVNSDSLIYNALLGLRYNFEKHESKWNISCEVFGGFNSVQEGMVGFAGAFDYKLMDFLYIGPVLGGYTQSHSAYLSKGLVPFNIGQIGDYDIVPLIGLEINFKMDLNPTFYIKLNNVITPVLTNTSLSLGINL
jgi:hypothetical protein